MNLRRTDNRKYPTLYASALLTLTKQGYTKHYFEGSRRICSKIGGGFSNVPQSDIDRRVAPVEPDYDEMHNSQRDGLVRTFAECLGAHPESDAARDLREVVDGCLALNDPEPAFFYISDHLGGTSFLANASGNLTQTLSYLPYGEEFVKQLGGSYDERFTFTGKEKDIETGYYYFGARFDNVDLGFMSVDPMSDKYPSISPYAYCAWNPVKYVDPEGREPIKSQAGTISGFVTFFNNTRTKMGTLKGAEAHNAMLRLGKTEWSWSSMRPMPATTNPFNNSKDKYIYTKEGGWIDMSHFMFYAGRAYEYKQNGEQYPMGKALKDGLFQEISDMFFAEHSAFSYEDLPSDKYGADFGANYFDPNSEQTFGEQLQNYFNEVLKATEPQNAPNYDNLPIEDTKKLPSRTNGSSFPVYTEQNP